MNLDSDPLCPKFIAASLAAFREWRSSPAGLDAMVAVMDIIEAAYTAWRTGQPVEVNVAGYGG